jgi:hypothetical protein
LPPLVSLEINLQDVQKAPPSRPQRVKARGVPFGYVEGLNDARTKLEGFFNILPEDYGWDIEGRQVCSGDMEGHQFLPLPPLGCL